MKKSELIRENWDKLSEQMIWCYEQVIRSYGRIEYQIYLWEDGEIELLQGPQGDNSWLKPRDAEPRELYYICTVDAPFFDPWDLSDHGAPDDEEEKEREYEEIIAWCMDEYKLNVDEKLSDIIEEVEREEMFED